jgi:hypothetical protein
MCFIMEQACPTQAQPELNTKLRLQIPDGSPLTASVAIAGFPHPRNEAVRASSFLQPEELSCIRNVGERRVKKAEPGTR